MPLDSILYTVLYTLYSTLHRPRKKSYSLKHSAWEIAVLVKY